MNYECKLERLRQLDRGTTDQYTTDLGKNIGRTRNAWSQRIASQPVPEGFYEYETKTAPTSVDIGIVIALKEEFNVLYEQIASQCAAIRDQETGNYVYQFNHVGPDDEASYRCIVTFVGQMGSLKAGLMTQKLLHDWKPRTLVMLGIAAALDSEVKPGDVVIASQVDAYLENAKAVRAPGKQRFALQPAGEVYRASSPLLRAAQNFEFAQKHRYHTWQKSSAQQLRRLLGSAKREDLLSENFLRGSARIHIGHVASGSTVSASHAFRDWLKMRDRKYLALEMEAAGFLAAAYEQGQMLQTLILRAISDFGDERKSELDKIKTQDTIEDGALRRYGLFNAIQLLWSFLDAGLLPHAL